MMTGCPHLRDRMLPTTRGTISAVPPAGNGTMILTARVGKSCAAAAPTQTARQAARMAAPRIARSASAESIDGFIAAVSPAELHAGASAAPLFGGPAPAPAPMEG